MTKYIAYGPDKEEIPVIADSIVIGAGMAGLSFARKEADPKGANHTVAIFDQRAELMSGASRNNPGRMGLGFHYGDLDTAITYLNATIAHVRKYKREGQDFRLGKDLPPGNPALRGWYFIPKKSLIPAEKLLDVYSALREEYRRLVNADPENKVFGEPDAFYRTLAYSEYKDVINVEKQDITLAIETPEQLMNVELFRQYLINSINNNNNIETHLKANITHIERTPDGEYFVVTVEQNGKPQKYAAKQVINASWESTDKLNQTLGVVMQPAEYNLILVSEEDGQPCYTEKELEYLAKKFQPKFNDKKAYRTSPLQGTSAVIIKKANGQFQIYGNTDGSKWAINDLPSELPNDLSSSLPPIKVFEHIKFPNAKYIEESEESKKVVTFSKGAVPVYIRKAIAAAKGHTPSPFRTNRIKVLAEVTLPPELVNQPCMFFAIGAFCMFSNMLNGRGLMTYAPETNYIKSQEIALTPQEEAKLHSGFTVEEIGTIGTKIINGVTEFIPHMEKAKLIGIRGGVVKTDGGVELCDPNSDFHKRERKGISEVALGVLEISSMKLFYGEANAEQAMKLLEQFKEVKNTINHIAEELGLFYAGKIKQSKPIKNETNKSEQPSSSPSGSPPVDCFINGDAIAKHQVQMHAASKTITHYFSAYLKHYSKINNVDEHLSAKLKAAVESKGQINAALAQVFSTLDENELQKNLIVPSSLKK